MILAKYVVFVRFIESSDRITRYNVSDKKKSKVECIINSLICFSLIVRLVDFC